ncbi:MAG TPA: hypothetical protein VGI81_24670 [Tepidisphaeraceae bacterium]|jgi:hypothetical protein
MGQAANNRGRNASLDDRKARAAGRGLSQGYKPDFDDPPGRKRTLGAFGSTGAKRAKSPSSKVRNAGAAGKPKR